jgi:hypothetical protein
MIQSPAEKELAATVGQSRAEKLFVTKHLENLVLPGTSAPERQHRNVSTGTSPLERHHWNVTTGTSAPQRHHWNVSTEYVGAGKIEWH